MHHACKKSPILSVSQNKNRTNIIEKKSVFASYFSDDGIYFNNIKLFD